MSHAGQRIKQLRESQGLTLAELGAKVGVTAQAVSNWERPESKTLKGASLIRAAEALGVDPRELLSDDNHSALTNDETELLRVYRSLPAGHKAIAQKLLKALK